MDIRKIVDVPVVSRCTHVNILQILNDMERYFKCQMQASIELYEGEQLVNETWDDLQIIKGKLRILCDVHLITLDECTELEIVFYDIRSEYLDKIFR